MSVYPRKDVTKQHIVKQTWIRNGVESYSEYGKGSSLLRYSDSATQKRKRPALPFLSPTTLKRYSYESTPGVANYISFRSQSDWMVLEGNTFTKRSGQTQFDGWRILPGMSVAGNGVPTITRDIDREYLLRNKMLEKIKDLNLSFPVAILEGRQTASWIAQRVTSLAHAFGGVKRGKWERVRDAINAKGGGPPKAVTVTLGRYGYKRQKPSFYRNPHRLPERPPEGWTSKSASERWLEVQYAIKPLISDVEGAAAALAKYLDDNHLIMCTRRAVVWDVAEHTVQYSCGTRADHPEIFVGVDFTSVIKYRMQITYTFDTYLAAFVQNGLTNLPSTAYEVIPYSFVGDWFITVGDYLELLDATVGCKFISGVSSKQLRCVTTNASFRPEPGIRSPDLTPPFVSGECYMREVIGAFPTPQVVVKSPLSTSHVISALALIRVNRR